MKGVANLKKTDAFKVTNEMEESGGIGMPAIPSLQILLEMQELQESKEPKEPKTTPDGIRSIYIPSMP